MAASFQSMEFGRLENELFEKKGTIETLEEQLYISQQQITRLTEDCRLLRQKNNQLSDDLTTRAKHIEDLAVQVSTMTDNHKKLEEEVDKLQGDLENAHQSKEKSEEKIQLLMGFWEGETLDNIADTLKVADDDDGEENSLVGLTKEKIINYATEKQIKDFDNYCNALSELCIDFEKSDQNDETPEELPRPANDQGNGKGLYTGSERPTTHNYSQKELVSHDKNCEATYASVFSSPSTSISFNSDSDSSRSPESVSCSVSTSLPVFPFRPFDSTDAEKNLSCVVCKQVFQSEVDLATHYTFSNHFSSFITPLHLFDFSHVALSTESRAALERNNNNNLE